MRNVLLVALREHLAQFKDNPEQLNHLYQLFKEEEENTAEALGYYADLIFNYAVYENSAMSKIDSTELLAVGAVLKRIHNALTLAQYGRDGAGFYLDRIAGGENENKA
nr:hypothetical protein [uncultured Haemophilus sp.]